MSSNLFGGHVEKKACLAIITVPKWNEPLAIQASLEVFFVFCFFPHILEYDITIIYSIMSNPTLVCSKWKRMVPHIT